MRGETLVDGTADALRRVAVLLDPRTPFVYRRTQVAGGFGAFAIKFVDFGGVTRTAEDLGYERLEEGANDWRYPLVGVRVRLEIDDDGDTSDGSTQAVLRETIEFPGTVTWLLLAAIGAAFGWVYLPAPLDTVAVALTVAAFGSFLLGFVVIPSPIDTYLDRVQQTEGEPTSESESSEETADSNGKRQEPSRPEVDTGSLSTLEPRTYKTSCIGPSATALLAGFVASGPVFLTGMPIVLREVARSPYMSLSTFRASLSIPLVGVAWMLGFWVLGLLLGLFIYTYEDAETRIRVFPFDLIQRNPLPVPELSSGYLSLLGLAATPLVALTNSYFLLPVVYRLNTPRLWLYFLFPPALLAVTLSVFLYWWVVQNREYVYDRTLAGLTEIESSATQALFLVIATAGSYLLLGSFVEFTRKYWSYLVGPVLNTNPTPVIEKPLLVLILVASAFPAVYFLFGLVYQTVTHLASLLWTIRHSTVVGRSPTRGVPVRLTPSPRPEAVAVAIGPWRSVVVSLGLYRLFEDHPERFAAIVMHEEAHLIRDGKRVSDAQLSSLIPLFGALVLTGKNVLYALADFRSREAAADDFAAAHAGADPLAEALETLEEQGARSPGRTTSPFLPVPGAVPYTPFARPASVRSALERYFGLLFGSFALVRAHPSLRDRRERLQPEHE